MANTDTSLTYGSSRDAKKSTKKPIQEKSGCFSWVRTIWIKERMLNMKRFKRNGRTIKGTNAIDPATTTSKDWGFTPVSGKGGATTNFVIPEWMFDRELEEMYDGKCG